MGSGREGLCGVIGGYEGATEMGIHTIVPKYNGKFSNPFTCKLPNLALHKNTAITNHNPSTSSARQNLTPLIQPAEVGVKVEVGAEHSETYIVSLKLVLSVALY